MGRHSKGKSWEGAVSRNGRRQLQGRQRFGRPAAHRYSSRSFQSLPTRGRGGGQSWSWNFHFTVYEGLPSWLF